MPNHETVACRTTQHCAFHGWCRRCDPAFAAVMSRVNVAIQRTDADDTHWGPLYAAVAEALRPAAVSVPPPATRADDQASATVLTQTERDMLRYALDLAQERMLCVGDEFSEDDHDAIDSLRRLAAEAESTAEAHSCRNCEGIDPDTCLMNPNRPPEQCPRSEGDGYGLQCQKPAGHNLCTFEEEQPPSGPCVAGEQQNETPEAATVHAVPLPGSNGISSCCGRPPCEFVGERVTRDPDKVTCTGPAAGVRQDGATP